MQKRIGWLTYLQKTYLFVCGGFSLVVLAGFAYTAVFLAAHYAVFAAVQAEVAEAQNKLFFARNSCTLMAILHFGRRGADSVEMLIFRIWWRLGVLIEFISVLSFRTYISPKNITNGVSIVVHN